MKVGSEPGKTKVYTLYKGVLSFYSGFFAAAFPGRNWEEAQSNTIDLEDEEDIHFDRFVLWLYSRQLPISEDFSTSVKAICILWVFADKYDIPLLANQLIDLLRDAVSKHWKRPITQLVYMYDNTTSNALLRRFIVFLLSRSSGPDLLTPESRGRWPPDALWDVLQQVCAHKESHTSNLTQEEVKALDMCEYHSHPDGTKCKKTEVQGRGEK